MLVSFQVKVACRDLLVLQVRKESLEWMASRDSQGREETQVCVRGDCSANIFVVKSITISLSVISHRVTLTWGQ